MIIKSYRNTLATLALTLVVALPAASQQPGQNANSLPPHVREQLWPEQHLSPAEEELKEHVLVARDSLTRIEASIALLQRQQRGAGSAAVVRSTARALASDCARGTRTAKWLGEYSTTLSTSDPKWGNPSIRAYRAATASLQEGMAKCESAIGRELDRDTPDHDRLATAAVEAHRSVADYRRAEEGLLRTLKIRIDPGKTGPSNSR